MEKLIWALFFSPTCSVQSFFNSSFSRWVMLHHGSDLYCGYRLLVLVWASGKHQLSKSFQKKAFLIFLPERGITAAQTKHQIQSWSTSKLPLLYLLSVLRHHSLHTPSTASPNCSPRPFLDLVLLLFFFIHWLSTDVAVLPPPSSSFSLLIALLLSVWAAAQQEVVHR